MPCDKLRKYCHSHYPNLDYIDVFLGITFVGSCVVFGGNLIKTIKGFLAIVHTRLCQGFLLLIPHKKRLSV